MSRTITPLGAVGRGLVGGAIGTGIMTGAQMLAAKLRPDDGDEGGDPGGGNGGPPEDPWESASAPAKVARRIIAGVFHRDVSPERIGLLTNVMHWAYGTGSGAVYGLLRGSGALRGPRGGALFGLGVWGFSYAQLVPMGIYEPPWRYGPAQLAEEGGLHLVYGLGVAAGYAATRPLGGATSARS